MVSQAQKGERFKALHERPGAFIIPNPWDAGSARLLESFGFEALATTSSGLAQTLGRLDGEVTLQEKLEHCAALSNVTGIPISADLERCFADEPQGVADTIIRVADTGVVGGSIEDYSGNADRPLYDLAHAVERVQAAVEAARTLEFPFMLTARAERLLRSTRDLDDVISRLQAFESAGADVLYAPGLSSLEEVRLVTQSVTRPVNVLVPFLPGVTLDELAEAGAKRISVGGALARVALGSLMSAAAEMHDSGQFDWMSRMAESRGLDKRLSGAAS